MNKEKIENILTALLATGGEFAEAFIEKKTTKVFDYIDNRLDSLEINNSSGIGLRLAKENDIYYGSTNDFSDDSINKIVSNLNKNINSNKILDKVTLQDLKEYKKDNITHYSNLDIKNKLQELNTIIRSKDEKITQVDLRVLNVEQNVTIANHTGLYACENRVRSRLFIIVNMQDGDLISSASYSKGLGTSLDFLDDINFAEVIDELIKEGNDKLYAKPCIGKVMPVVIGPGFGGVIFHEACGHAMEATSVADKLSVLSNDLDKTVASSKVTIIDDGTICDEWGSTQIDDEGMETQKNILIEDGVLKGFLIDELNNRKMHMQPTGSGRRESYMYAPTSRMNNTYLKPGNDSIEDMIKSIDLGLFAAKMGGGTVSTETGDFNFACDVAYMIRDGKLAEPVKSASLIGNTKEILKEVEMVSSNFKLGPGMCGSLSGWVPVNVGEPTIKVGHILVGGEEE